MIKSKRACVKCLSRTDRETIFYKLLILCKDGSFQDAVSAISVITEHRMPNVLHMHPDLMRTTGFKHALHKADIIQVLEHLVMCPGFLAAFAFFKYSH